MEDSIKRLEIAVDKCIENSRNAGRAEGALRVIERLDISKSRAISLLADVLHISKSQAAKYYNEYFSE